ncbi:MAG: 30S ribosomal protein S5, partial [Nanoarchaeota archaeon]|nr:30S ribosomal protein S5 [Nanoarchaeota archaeon]
MEDEVEEKQEIEEEKQQKSYNFKTELGKKVLSGEIKNIDEILDSNLKILEEGIVDYLLPDLEIEYLYIGQSRGKLGGGKRRIVKNTQKVTAEGKRQRFSAVAVVGDKKGHLGIGRGSGLESVIAKEKAVKNAKLNITKVLLGCGSSECACREKHSIPFVTTGRSGSVRVTLIPAPKGVGACTADDIKTIIRLAGIKDVWSKVIGQTGTRVNL